MIKKFIYMALTFAPIMAFAQNANLSGISNLVTQFGQILAKVIPIVFAIAIIYFFWGVAKYIRSAGDPKEAAAGKSIMIWGIIAIAVMVSIYGLIAWLQGSFGINPGGTVVLPEVPRLGQ